MAKMKELLLPKDIQFFLKRLNPGYRKEREEIEDNEVTFGKHHVNDFVIKDARVANYHGALNYGKIDKIEGWYLCNYDKKFGTFYDGVNIGDKDVLVHPGVPIRLTEDASSTFFLEIETSKKRDCKPSSSSSVWSIYEGERIAEDDDVFMEADAFDVKDGISSDFGVHSIVTDSDDALVEGTAVPIHGATNVSNARKRKSEVALDYITPKRKPRNALFKKKTDGEKENSGENWSDGVILEKKLQPLKPYLDAIEASDDLIKSLNKCKRQMDVKFMEIVIKSMDDRESCFVNECESLSDSTKRIKQQLLNLLIRGRTSKESNHCKASKIKIVDSCSMRDKCMNLYHREFEEDPDEKKAIELGGYLFSADKRDNSWGCIACKSHQSKLRKHGKQYGLFGYLQYNSDTGLLEDKKRLTRANVDPENPGGKPHVCSQKTADDAEFKVERSEAAIKKRRPTIKERMEKIEKEIDALVKTIDETSFSSELKKMLEKFRGSFIFDSNHKRFFVYFITFAGEKDIMYYGITSEPNVRLRQHKLEIFSKDVKGKKVLQMHLIPLGRINIKFACELETSFIRLSKNMRLKEGAGVNRNDSKGEYSKESLLKPIIEAEDSDAYNKLVRCLDELFQVTFDQGYSILSTDVSDNGMHKTKKLLSDHVMIVKNSKRLKASTTSSKSAINFDNLPKELQDFLEELKKTFKFVKGDIKYYIYFFTYKDEPGVLYYGITNNPNQRWDQHKTDPRYPMFQIFKSKKPLQMHIIPLGDIDCMLAAELETILIRLSTGEYLNDGNVSVNPSKGRYSSIYSFHEEVILFGEGEKFESLVQNMNDLIAATIGSKNILANN